MIIISFLVQLAGAVMLLLFAVRMVRTGIERAFGSSFQSAVTRADNPVNAAATGVVLAIILQSSAAVALLVAGFAGAGVLQFAAGLSVVLGADLGSALLIQVLSFDLEWLVPVLLAVGGFLFIKTDSRPLKQAGRILIGIAFILISLRFLRETMEPIRDSAFLPSIAGYLGRDYLTAFIVGAGLAFLMHSSVAAILMCVTLASIGAIPVDAGVSLVLGANLGSALIPIWLCRDMDPVSRRVPLANLTVRGSGAIIALLAVNLLPVLDNFPEMGPAQTLISVHILFNAALLFALPVCNPLGQPFERLLPEVKLVEEDVPLIHQSVLDYDAPDRPALAIASLKREVLRMAQVVETMTSPIMDLYRDYDKAEAASIKSRDEIVNKALDDIRRYAAAMPQDSMRKADLKLARKLTEYAISIESAGDIVVKRLLPLAKEKSGKGLKFSEVGLEELISIHERVIANMALAHNVLISDDAECAKLLLEEKAEMSKMERKSRKRHLKRLTAGTKASFDSSDIHLETIKALREINSQISAVAYPILYRDGQLLDTRLIYEVSDKEVTG